MLQTNEVLAPTNRSLQTVNPNDILSYEYTEDVLIDFWGSDDGTPLEHGDYIKYQWKTIYGLTVEASASRGGYTPNGMARIYDTSTAAKNNYEGDPDLGSPNMRCSPQPGPGVGEGGEPGNPGENCDPQGNVLIIQESDKKWPDDNAYGGTLSFTFDFKVKLMEIGLMDIDEKRDTYFTIELDDGSEITESVAGLGDNSIQTMKFGPEDNVADKSGIEGVVKVSLITGRGSMAVRHLRASYPRVVGGNGTLPPTSPPPTMPPQQPLLCGPDITARLYQMKSDFNKLWKKAPKKDRDDICGQVFSLNPWVAYAAWDSNLWSRDWPKHLQAFHSKCAQAKECKSTVWITTKAGVGYCHHSGAVGYTLFGLLTKACGMPYWFARKLVDVYKGMQIEIGAEIEGCYSNKIVIKEAAPNYVDSVNFLGWGFLGLPRRSIPLPTGGYWSACQKCGEICPHRIIWRAGKPSSPTTITSASLPGI